MVSKLVERKGLLGALALLVLVAFAPPAALETAAQDAGDWTPVTIVYNSDVIGRIDPCG